MQDLIFPYSSLENLIMVGNTKKVDEVGSAFIEWTGLSLLRNAAMMVGETAVLGLVAPWKSTKKMLD